ncbi:uncharacterized protein LOC131678014 [Topomyia yanbarensis]|uniref:uncharacterized protein LOC131678014 n=1 Tax=Topomyia yanbarensis TaxID=2498891 RepID=UPI00273BC413|nr:uncharacterized protein LOC131678014 [Topomyia yanbarensis]
MAKLPSRGLKRLHNGAVLSEQQLASPIIRWTKPQDDEEQAVQQYLEVTLEKAATPHIVCLASPMRRGKYFLIVGNQLIVEPRNSIQALELLFKSFKVFGVDVPPELYMVYDFLACTVYGIISHSSRSSVNRLAASFQQAFQAEVGNKE